MVENGLWLGFLALVSLLWASGAWLFMTSRLSRRTRIVWPLVLIGVGVAIGFLLPLVAIRNRFLIVLAILPLLAFIDIRLARSSRTFLFWFRACAFEVCTIFAAAAVTRAALSTFVRTN